MLIKDLDPFNTPLPAAVDRVASISRRQRLLALLSAAKRALPVSKKFAEIHAKMGICNLRVIQNGISPRLPPLLPNATNTRKVVLGHVGGRASHKGATLVEIALRKGAFRNLELVMVDGTLEFGEEKFLEWGETKVRLVGQCPQDQINQLYSLFDVLLAPSLWPESYGLVAREALFYERWVVTSDRGAIGDDIVEGLNGFRVDVSDTRALTRILSLINENPLRYKTPPEARQAQRTAADQAVELADLYKEVLHDASTNATKAVLAPESDRGGLRNR